LRSPASNLKRAVGLWLILLTLLAPALLHAQLINDPRFVYEPDKTAAEDVPDWLREIPVPDGLSGARRDFQIIPPRAGVDLAITLSFNEPEGADNLLAYFRGARQGRTVAANLYQGTGLPNQRTIVLRNRLLTGPGVLSLVADGPELLIWRMEFQWMQARPVLVPIGPALDAPAAVLPNGQVLHQDEIASGEDRAPREEWLENVIRFPLVQEPERIEAGVEYIVNLETLPKAAVMQLDLAGLPPGAQTRVMINGKVAGWLQVALPSLAHGGYRGADGLGGGTELAGWRKAQAWLPVSLLVPGENTVWFEFFERAETEPTAEPAPADSGFQPALLFGVAARHLFLELDYTPVVERLGAGEERGVAQVHQSQTPTEQLVLSTEEPEDTTGEGEENDALPDEQTAAGPVQIRGELKLDLMGDLAPALMLFMEEAPNAEAPASAPAASPGEP
jgi:hypothetical protein